MWSREIDVGSKGVLMLRVLVASRRARYLAAGVWNTVFGYLVGVALYYVPTQQMHVAVVGLLANVVAISMAFVTYKVFVFQTRGNWLAEYARAYVVYGGTALVGTGLLWLSVSLCHFPFWIAQGGVIAITIVISYLSHSRFTFRRS